VALHTHVINFSTFIKQRRITASSEQIKKNRRIKRSVVRNEKSKLKTYGAGYLSVNLCDFYLEVIRLRFILTEVRTEALYHKSLYAVKFYWDIFRLKYKEAIIRLIGYPRKAVIYNTVYCFT
jgi:hypothetical protein